MIPTAFISLWVVASAQAEPEIVAMLSSDGAYVLVLRPEEGWIEAELVVGGDDTHQLGPAEAGAPIRIEGRTEGRWPLALTLRAAQEDGVGFDWQTSVDPTWVPLGVPALDPRPHGAGAGRSPP